MYKDSWKEVEKVGLRTTVLKTALEAAIFLKQGLVNTNPRRKEIMLDVMSNIMKTNAWNMNMWKEK